MYKAKVPTEGQVSSILLISIELYGRASAYSLSPANEPFVKQILWIALPSCSFANSHQGRVRT